MSTPSLAKVRTDLRPDESSGEASTSAAILGPIFLGGLALALGIVVLAGWAFALRPLTTILPDAVPMKANAAALLALLGAGIVVHATGRAGRLVGLFGTVVGVVVVATAIEYVARIDLGIDNVLAPDVAAPGAPYPGRMAIVTVLGFGACAGALLLFGRTWRGLHPTEALALVAGTIGALGVLGYAYGATELTSIGTDTRIAFPASLGFIVLSGAIIASDADHGLTRVLRDPHLSGRLGRRLVVMVLLGLPLAGLLAIKIGQLGATDRASATAGLVVVELLTFLLVGGWIIEGTRRIERASASLADALTVSERRFREALSDVSLVAVMLDVDGRVMFANRFVLELIGRTESEVIGRDWFEISMPPADLASRRAVYIESIEQGTVLLQRRGPLLGRGGEVRLIEWSSAYMRDETGLIVGMVGVGNDVTERRQAHDALEASETRLRTALDTMIDGTSILSAVRDEAGRIVDFRIDYANPAMARTGRVAADQQVGHTLLELFPAHGTNGLFDAYVEVVETGVPFRAEDFRYVDPAAADGPLDQYVDVGASKLGDGYVQSVRDVSDRHVAQAELHRLAMAIEQSADAIVITDAAANIEYVNPAFSQITGYTRDEVLGRNPRILKSGVQGPSFYAAMWDSLGSGSSFTSELTNRRKDGSLYREEAVISPVIDENGAIASYVAVKRDVTRERAIEAAHDRMATQRALIARTLSDLKADSSSAATAEAICRQVVNLPGIATANINYFTAQGPAMPLAFIRADGAAVVARRVPMSRSRVLRARAERGAWAEPWVRRPWHPYDRLFMELGVTAVAHAPIVQDGRLIGTLSVSAGGTDALAALTDSLPAVGEFAGFAGALLSAAIIDLNEVVGVRARIADIVRYGSFHPVFQPIVDIATGEHVGYEALTRFNNEVRPDIVFREAREAGLEAELELATLKAAIAGATGLPRGAWLSLNVSPQLVTGEKRLARILRSAARPLVLEITEHVPVADYAALREAIERLRPAVRVAVDDAGAGVANLSHIVELRPAFVKLDIGLVRGIDTDLTRKAMIFGLEHFAAESHSQSIAEGVETGAELDALRAIGVRYAQGYLLGKPARVADWSSPAVAGSRIA